MPQFARSVGFLVASLLALALPTFVHAGLAPYTADVATLHLWHLDEGTTPCADAVAGGTNFTSIANGATLGGASFTGFGSALSTVDGGQAGGATASAIDAALSPLPLANAASDNVAWSFADPNTGAFTFEAMVWIGFDPAANLGTGGTARNLPMQIFSGEQDGTGGGIRSWQFRLDPIGFNPGADGFTTALVQPAIEFINVNNGASVQNFVALIPTNGVDAIASNQWYHAAVTYNGSANTAGNLMIYWTLVSTNRMAASAISARQMTLSLNAGAVDLCVGNTGRNTPNNNFIGLIDEVRVSGVARATNEFIFQNISVTASSTQPATTNFPSNTLDGNLNSRWTAQGDGQYLTYDLGRISLVESIDLAFYQPSGIRTNWFDVLLSSDNLAWRSALTNKIGTNAALANFDFTDWPARYVRIVGHTNSANDFNSVVETVIHYSVPVDTDNDGLPDVWENFYFSTLTNTPAGDPDGDSQSNAYEFLHGTDPTVFNTSGDTDGDGLPDSWEIAKFGNLNQTATGDPDRDGFNNLAEYQNGSDPNNANSIPGDTNGNNLPDAWEIASLGGLVKSAYDDADGDGYHNLAEMIAGTNPTNALSHPSWISPRVALLRDSVLTTNACLMASSAPYGRAINGISFQTRILAKYDGYEYTAWYDTTGSGNGTQTIWLARRTVNATSSGAWEKYSTGSLFVNGKGSWDAHNVVSLGISPDGTLHYSWDMHGNTLRYRHSVAGLCTTNKVAWGGAGMFTMASSGTNWLVANGQTIANVTYPMFVNRPSGELMFEYRTGNTTAGDHWLHTWLPATTNWTTGIKFSAKEGTYTGVLATGVTGSSTSRNPYENNFDFAPDGTLHHTWTYRELADAANHDLCYAYSTNNGVTWFNNGGTNITDTGLGTSINVSSPGIIIKVLDSRQRFINQQAQCVDNDGRVHILALHRRAEPDAAWVFGDSVFSVVDTAYFHYFRDPVTHVWSQRRIPWTAFPVGSRPKLGYDAQGNLYGVYLSYASTNTDVVPGYIAGKLVIASASKASQYTDWQVVQSLTNDLNGEPLIDQARLLADNILSVFIQENSATTTVVGTPLHVFDFAVNVTPPNTLALNFVAQDSLVTFSAMAGHNYQLQSASILSPPNWTNASAVLPGINGLMSLPDPNGRSATQRFYRFVQDP